MASGAYLHEVSKACGTVSDSDLPDDLKRQTWGAFTASLYATDMYLRGDGARAHIAGEFVPVAEFPEATSLKYCSALAATHGHNKSAGNTARQFTAVFERTLATPGMGAGSGASASDAPHTEVYMTFMGSQSSQDWVHNLKTWCDLTNRQLPGGAGAVHHGVMKRAESVPIDTLVARLNRGNCTVVLCGHSLGGAVATLVCHRLLAHPTADVASWSKNKRLRCITFGAPLVGDGKLGCHVAGVDFLDVFHSFVNNRDVLCRLTALARDTFVKAVDWIAPACSKRSIMDGVMAAVAAPTAGEVTTAVGVAGAKLLGEALSIGHDRVPLVPDFAPVGTYYIMEPTAAALVAKCSPNPERGAGAAARLHAQFSVKFADLAVTDSQEHLMISYLSALRRVVKREAVQPLPGTAALVLTPTTRWRPKIGTCKASLATEPGGDTVVFLTIRGERLDLLGPGSLTLAGVAPTQTLLAAPNVVCWKLQMTNVERGSKYVLQWHEYFAPERDSGDGPYKRWVPVSTDIAFMTRAEREERCSPTLLMFGVLCRRLFLGVDRKLLDTEVGRQLTQSYETVHGIVNGYAAEDPHSSSWLADQLAKLRSLPTTVAFAVVARMVADMAVRNAVSTAAAKRREALTLQRTHALEAILARYLAERAAAGLAWTPLLETAMQAPTLPTFLAQQCVGGDTTSVDEAMVRARLANTLQREASLSTLVEESARQKDEEVEVVGDQLGGVCTDLMQVARCMADLDTPDEQRIESIRGVLASMMRVHIRVSSTLMQFRGWGNQGFFKQALYRWFPEIAGRGHEVARCSNYPLRLRQLYLAIKPENRNISSDEAGLSAPIASIENDIRSRFPAEEITNQLKRVAQGECKLRDIYREVLGKYLAATGSETASTMQAALWLLVLAGQMSSLRQALFETGALPMIPVVGTQNAGKSTLLGDGFKMQHLVVGSGQHTRVPQMERVVKRADPTKNKLGFDALMVDFPALEDSTSNSRVLHAALSTAAACVIMLDVEQANTDTAIKLVQGITSNKLAPSSILVCLNKVDKMFASNYKSYLDGLASGATTGPHVNASTGAVELGDTSDEDEAGGCGASEGVEAAAVEYASRTTLCKIQQAMRVLRAAQQGHPDFQVFPMIVKKQTSGEVWNRKKVEEKMKSRIANNAGRAYTLRQPKDVRTWLARVCATWSSDTASTLRHIDSGADAGGGGGGGGGGAEASAGAGSGAGAGST